jgi:hypothetical protein
LSWRTDLNSRKVVEDDWFLHYRLKIKSETQFSIETNFYGTT